MSKEKKTRAVQTTGHAWDGDIQEFNNPLPAWWVWGFYATVVFAVIYWILYPAWPFGNSYTKGVGNNIEYETRDGKKVVHHWTTRALYQKEMEVAWKKQQVEVAKFANVTYDDIAKDRSKRAYAISVANVLFADNCAACHQPGGAGLTGTYPSLVDDDWIWGGQYEQIETSIRKGRSGAMPSFAKTLSDQNINDVADYVYSLSAKDVAPASVAAGKLVFETNCAACHTKAGSGNVLMGSANLTDHIWTVAQLTAGMDATQSKNAIKKVIRSGISRKMPAWEGRFSDLEIKMLTFYVHELASNN